MSKVDLPDIPDTDMFIGKTMTIEWQEFFRTLFERVGGRDAKTNLELEQLALEAKNVPAMLFDSFTDESEPVIIPGPKGDKGDQGMMGPPGMDGEGEDGFPFVGFPQDISEGELNEIIGDGTAGRVLRVSNLDIENGTAANSIKPSTASWWNADSGGPVDNIEKGDTSGGFTLDITGSILTIVCQHIGGTSDAHVIAVIALWVYSNASGTDLCVKGTISGTSLELTFTNSISGAAVDLTTLVDTGTIKLQFSTLTAE